MSGGLWQRLRAGLARTREAVTGQVRQLLPRGAAVDEAVFERLEEILIGADVGVETSLRLVEGVRERARRQRHAGADQVIAWLREEVRALLGADEGEVTWPPAEPLYVAMFVGVNGTGKTTSVAKLAKRLKDSGRSVILAAADTFRAAAGDQLAVWASRLGVEIVRQEPGADPAAIAFDAIQAARARKRDAVLVDTAGRLHNKAHLLAELEKIKRVCDRAWPGAPHEVLLVIDATTGQNGLVQAQEFQRAVGVTGIVLTKLDGTAKGGIVLAIRERLGVPVRWVGLGEGVDDLQPFSADAFVRALFDEAE